MANKSAFPEYDDELQDWRIPNAIIPGKNKDLANFEQQQLDFAKNFRKNIPSYSDELYNNYAKGSRRDLAQNINKNRAGFNSRGLLRSGMREGSELGLKANNANELYSARDEINKGLLGQADELESGAFNTDGNRAGLGPGLGGSSLAGVQSGVQNQIAGMNAQQSIYGGIGSGVGNFLGTYYGRKKS